MVIKFQEKFSLKAYNTFGIDCTTDYFTIANNIEDLKKSINFATKNNITFMVLGSGSNILFTENYQGLIILNDLKGVEIKNSIKENKIIISAKSGENWHEFVLFCIKNNFGGIENLSLIPGKVGTSPIQNIGAYGVEIKDVLKEVKVLDIEDLSIKTFSNKECKFGYRDSIFKSDKKGKYIIIEVSFELSIDNHNLKIDYGDIQKILKEKNILSPSIKDISNIIIEIRQKKLPDPEKLGNAGSFFKNPIINSLQLELIKNKYPDIPNFFIQDGKYKIPAGWLIEKSGLKGRRFNNCGVHENQALVLVNYGGAEGKEILELSDYIIEKIYSEFSITLEREVNIV